MSTVLSNAGQSSPTFMCSGSSLFLVTFDDYYSTLAPISKVISDHWQISTCANLWYVGTIKPISATTRIMLVKLTCNIAQSSQINQFIFSFEIISICRSKRVRGFSLIAKFSKFLNHIVHRRLWTKVHQILYNCKASQ